MPSAGHALLPEGATALEIPSDSDRPAFVTRRKGFDVFPAATAVRLDIPEPRWEPYLLDPTGVHSRRPTCGPTVYCKLSPDPELEHFARRFAHAYITPDASPCRDEPGPFFRLVFRTLALDLPQTFELLTAQHDADVTVRFRTPEDREAAMRRQPFQLDGATVELVREGETPDIALVRYDYMVHVALRDYPVEQEQRTEKDIDGNCCNFGFVQEIDPACFAAPDLSTVHVVLMTEHPSEIARELRITYFNGSTSVVPVEIVSVWDCSKSFDANGQYVRLFQHPVPARRPDA